MTSARKGIEQAGGLATVAELAKRWGITTQWAWELSRRDGFPAPITTLGGRDLFFVSETDAALDRVRTTR